MPRFMDYFIPFGDIILKAEHDDVGAVRCNLFGSQVIKFKYVLDEFLFGTVDSTLFTADVNHHAYFFLGNIVILLVGVNLHQPQYAVGGFGEQPYERSKDNGYE